MKSVAIIRVWQSSDCYECDGNVEKQLVSDFEEVSDEDYSYIKRAISQQTYQSYPRYIMVEQSSIEEVKEDMKSFLAKIRKQEKDFQQTQKDRAAKEVKRQETLRIKREEKERKKFEELKKKFEESSKD